MRHAFDAALKTFERSDAEPEPAPRRYADLAARLAAVAPAACGHHSLWDLAAAWTPEADPPPPPAPPPPAPPPSDRIEDIAAELDFFALRSPQDLARARRRFMWGNHPDRRPDIDRALANRRVALANMLLDSALAALRPRRKR